MKEYEINGCVTVSDNVSIDDFIDSFIDFIESKNWTYGGGIREINEEDIDE